MLSVICQSDHPSYQMIVYVIQTPCSCVLSIIVDIYVVNVNKEIIRSCTVEKYAGVLFLLRSVICFSSAVKLSAV